MNNNSFPSNEAETIELFRLGQTRLGWSFAHLQIAFPDAVIENERGQQLVAEFEYEAKNFHKHGHPVDGTADLIICWHNNWPDAPLPVWALEECLQGAAELVSRTLRAHDNEAKRAIDNLTEELICLSRAEAKAQEWEEKAQYWMDRAKYWKDEAEYLEEMTEGEGPPKRNFDWLVPPGMALFGFICVAGVGSFVNLSMYDKAGPWGTAAVVLIFLLIAYSAIATSIAEYVNSRLEEKVDG